MGCIHIVKMHSPVLSMLHPSGSMRGGLIEHEKEARRSLVVELDHDARPGFLTRFVVRRQHVDDDFGQGGWGPVLSLACLPCMFHEGICRDENIEQVRREGTGRCDVIRRCDLPGRTGRTAFATPCRAPARCSNRCQRALSAGIFFGVVPRGFLQRSPLYLATAGAWQCIAELDDARNLVGCHVFS